MGLRDLAKRALPSRFVNWYRRKRINILEAAGGATRITPRILLRAFSRKTQPARAFVRRAVIKVLPDRLVNRYRRRRVTKQYLDALSWELLERETRLDYLEGRVAARRDGFYERIVHDVLERTEIILQELDRRIEGVSARTGQRLHAVEDQLVQLREELGRLRRIPEPPAQGDGDGSKAPVKERPEDAEPAHADAADADSTDGDSADAEPAEAEPAREKASASAHEKASASAPAREEEASAPARE